MALVNCRNCGNIVSDRAEACPHCGIKLIEECEPRGSVANNPIPAPPTNPTPAPQTKKVEMENGRIKEVEEVDVIDDNEVVEEQTSGKLRRWKLVIIPLFILLVSVTTSVLVYVLFATDEPATTDESSRKAPANVATPPTENVRSEEPVVDTPPADDGSYKLYGEWGEHIATFFRIDAIEIVGDGRYRVNTGDLCPRLNSAVNPTLEEGVVSAVVFADRINMRSSRTTSSADNIINKLGFGDPVRIVEVDGDNWAKIEVLDAEGNIVEGYVSSLYLCDTARFELISTHITPDSSSRENIDEAKWRRALAEVLYNIGITATTPAISSDVVKIYNSGADERVVVFGMSRADSEVKLLVAIEFFKGNEEFRLLAIVPGSSVVDVRSTGQHTYDLQYRLK